MPVPVTARTVNCFVTCRPAGSFSDPYPLQNLVPCLRDFSEGGRAVARYGRRDKCSAGNGEVFNLHSLAVVSY
jgi:hypothetical protein